MKIGTILAILQALADLFRYIAGVRKQQAIDIVETERGKAAQADDEDLRKEVNKWTAP